MTRPIFGLDCTITGQYRHVLAGIAKERTGSGSTVGPVWTITTWISRMIRRLLYPISLDAKRCTTSATTKMSWWRHLAIFQWLLSSARSCANSDHVSVTRFGEILPLQQSFSTRQYCSGFKNTRAIWQNYWTYFGLNFMLFVQFSLSNVQILKINLPFSHTDNG